jgi:hypothetical protein
MFFAVQETNIFGSALLVPVPGETLNNFDSKRLTCPAENRIFS